ncbi:hypothetical protein D6745_01820 [Candidatus Woesearchaeota archaeon]|nr:MAG: hypothetical protein D6745_01820 [Candidatus Woesearchaeota archaeon]
MARNDYYVGIEYPKSLRKNILETSRLMIYILEKNERAKQINREKLQGIKSLRQNVHEIKFLMAKLRDRLSKAVDEDMRPYTLSSTKKTSEKEQTLTGKTKKKAVKQRKKSSEIAELEEELAEIEETLKKLE